MLRAKRICRKKKVYNSWLASNPNIPVAIPRFYEDNVTAMNDIKRCAELEAKGA